MKDLFNIRDKVIVVTGATGVLAGGAAKYLQEEQGAKSRLHLVGIRKKLIL